MEAIVNVVPFLSDKEGNFVVNEELKSYEGRVVNTIFKGYS